LWFVLILSAGIFALWRTTNELFAEPFGLLFSIAVFTPIAVWLDKRSRTWFDITGEKKLRELRHCAMEIAHTEPKTDALVHRFETLFSEKFQTQSAYLLFDDGPVHGRNDLVIAKDRAGHAMLCELGWATPESLERRRSTASLRDLKQFLEANAFGLMIPVPRGSATPSLLVALSTRPDDRPYTFPEIERIQNLTELVDSILTRSKLTSQAELHARTEFLNMMSRALAHDLKNLITPVSTFLIHTERMFTPNSVEAEVHAAARRAMQTITEYVRETLYFSDRLEPHFQRLSIKSICDSVLGVMSMHAAKRGVQIALTGSSLAWIVADGVLTQRMLGNLVSNAVDASAAGQAVTLKVSALPAGWVRFEVRDNGCGIPAEHLCRIFDPYFTTKRFGEKMRGFGLGLTIAHRIALLHRGKIHVQSRPGQQTIVAVDMPGEQGSVSPAAA
jgi:signal transduction histidine kinase